MLLDDETGQLDRDALRRMMVADDNMRRSLDRITHPYILWQMAWEVVSLAAEGHSFAVLDIPLLFESGGKLLRFDYSCLHRVAIIIAISFLISMK